MKKSDIIAYGLKMKIGLVKAGDLSAIPVKEIPIEKGEPLALELAHFVESVAKARQPKVGGALAMSALEVAIKITEQIRAGHRNGSFTAKHAKNAKVGQADRPSRASWPSW